MPARAEAPSPDADAVLAILSRPDDVDLAELVELVARICDSTAAGITVQRGEDYHVPVTHGIEPLVCPSDDTFCRATMSTDGIFVVEDATTDPQFSSIGFVDGSIADARFYASAPLYAPSGEMVGRLCVIDPEPKTLTPLQRRSLETLALSVTKLIELRLLRERPAPSAPEVGQAAATVVSQLAAEVSHDMRVPLSAIIAGVEMLADELQDHPDPAVGALLTRTARAADRLSRMLDQHMELGGVLDTPKLREVDLGAVDRAAAGRHGGDARAGRRHRRERRAARAARGPRRHVLRAAQPPHQLGEVRAGQASLRSCGSPRLGPTTAGASR